MTHNSAVVMWGGCQERYKHGVPCMTKGVGIHPMAGERLRCRVFWTQRFVVLLESF